MKTTSTKKYPLLISAIVSCVLVVVSLFILGFFGMKLGTSLGGGSQFEVVISNDANTKEYVKDIKAAVADHGYRVDSSFVEEKFKAGESQFEYTERCLVIKIADKDICDAKETEIRNAVAEKLGIDVDNVSSIDVITSVIKGKDVLFLGIALGIIVACLFVYAWIRYNLFAGLSFILANLHNVILFLSLMILSRVQVNMISLVAIVVLTLIMSAVLIVVYEKYRELANLKTEEKMTISQRMATSEKTTLKPYAIIAGIVLVFALLMLFVPVSMVRFAALGIIFALIVTAYTTLIIGPGSYAALLELKNDYLMAVLSRNDTVNKEIKKKIKNAKKVEEAKAEAKKAEAEKAEKEPVVKEEKVEEKKVEEKKKTTTKKSTSSKKKSTKKQTHSRSNKFK